MKTDLKKEFVRILAREITPGDLVDLAHKDVVRLSKKIQEGVPGLSLLDTHPPPEGYKILRRGFGPNVLVTSGYAIFRDAYVAVTESLVKDLIEELSYFEKPWLFLQVRYQIDSDLNVFGDFMQHKFVLGIVKSRISLKLSTGCFRTARRLTNIADSP
jgi:hypothetical protein